MTGRHSPQSYIARAESTLSEARILIQASAVRGTCNRAYYAMFYAVHAALFALGIEGLTRQGMSVAETSRRPGQGRAD